MANAGASIALNYGYVWLTGQRLQYYQLVNTNNTFLDYTRIGMWALGEGEMDGCEELWDSGLERLLYTSENDDPTHFHFHRGCDAVIGTGQALTSSGPDQGIDNFWNSLPPGNQPLNYNRIAYYALFLKLLNNNIIGGVQQGDASDWADLNPVGLWRGIRCRLFDGSGQMTGYSFTTNCAWHFVDVLLRRKIYPEYNIDITNGPDDLTDAVRKRFDWGSIAAAANKFDTILDTGNRQFEGSYSFSQPTSLQAILSQILQCCRSFMRETSGMISLICDDTRPSVFTFSRKNAYNFEANDADLHSAANRYIAKFRDLQIPAAADIASIVAPDHAEATVTTVNPHPFVAADRIVIGGTDSKYDSQWVVDTIGAPDENNDVYTLNLVTKGSNYPAYVGPGGSIGLLYSRFKDRAPEFNHHRNQVAKGAIGNNIPRQRNKVKLETDFASCIYDQVNRISRYQRDRALGPDAIPYITPVSGELECPLFALDAAGSGNIAIGIETGDHITVDDTLSVSFAGEYEVLKATPVLAAANPSSSDAIQASPAGGTLRLTLGNYSDDVFYTTSNPAEAGFESVPGSQPGNDSSYTTIDLEDGIAAFFTGTGADSTSFSMPSAGFNPANLLAWASPQGYIEGDAHLHYFRNVGVDPTRQLHLVYSPSEGADWTGDLNFAALTWRSRNSVRVFTQGEYTFAELTLSGGEIVCFGQGRCDPSTAVVIPDGYTQINSILMSFPHTTQQQADHPAHGFRAYVGVDGKSHHDMTDGEGNNWEGDTHPMMFFWKNNAGTVTRQNGWVKFPLATGKTLFVGGFSILDPNLGGVAPPNFPATDLFTILLDGKITIPPTFSSTTLQTMIGANSFQITDHDAHGVKANLVDGDNIAHTPFEDGDGNIWYGSSGVFALLCDTPSVIYVPPEVHPI